MLARPQHRRNTSRDMAAIATSSCTHETKRTPIMTEDYVIKLRSISAPPPWRGARQRRFRYSRTRSDGQTSTDHSQSGETLMIYFTHPYATKWPQDIFYPVLPGAACLWRPKPMNGDVRWSSSRKPLRQPLKAEFRSSFQDGSSQSGRSAAYFRSDVSIAAATALVSRDVIPSSPPRGRQRFAMCCAISRAK